MNPANLIKGKTYHYTVVGREPVEVEYRYPTLNCWWFDYTDRPEFTLLHYHQVLRNITEIAQ